MTIQDLKENREEIIHFINSMNFNLNFAMQLSVELAANCDNLDDLKYEIQQHCKSVKETKNARILGRLQEIEIENN